MFAAFSFKAMAAVVVVLNELILFCKVAFAVFEAVSFVSTSACTAADAVAAVVAFVATFDVNVLMLFCKVVSAASLSDSFWSTSACRAAMAVPLAPFEVVISVST